MSWNVWFWIVSIAAIGVYIWLAMKYGWDVGPPVNFWDPWGDD